MVNVAGSLQSRTQQTIGPWLRGCLGTDVFMFFPVTGHRCSCSLVVCGKLVHLGHNHLLYIDSNKNGKF